MKHIAISWRTLFVCLLILSPLRTAAQSSASPATPPVNAPAHGDRIRTAGLRNFGRINEHLYRGAQPHDAGMHELKKLGITTIVDLRGEDRERIAWERKESESLGIHFVHIPVSGWAPPTDTQVAQFLSIFRDNPQERVFVHCRFGDDRTGVFVATYRMVFDNFLSDDALHEMYFFGFNGVWHPAMTTFIREFPGRLNTDPPLAKFKKTN